VPAWVCATHQADVVSTDWARVVTGSVLPFVSGSGIRRRVTREFTLICQHVSERAGGTIVMAGLQSGAPTPQSITVHSASRVLEIGFSDGQGIPHPL